MAEINNALSEEMSLKELFEKGKEWWSFLLTQWWKIMIIGLVGGVVGFIYAMYQPTYYTAKMTFVVEEGKSGSSGLGGLASLAGQFGVDVGGGGGSNVLSGDNIILYFKTATLARKVLLSKYSPSSNKSIADEFVEVYELNKKWKKNKEVGEVYFPVHGTVKGYSRLQDSLIREITDKINSTMFSINRTDKKASFIDVTTTMENEMLAKTYCERILQEGINRYIEVKVQKQKSTVEKLQFRVDSIANLLGKKTASGAALQTSSNTMDINPLYRTGTAVAVETTVRDKAMLGAIFASVTQNLELAKFTLSQETPVIQLVDASTLPLRKAKLAKKKAAIIASFLFAFGFAGIIIVRKIIKTSNN
jgi:uncharacterized protein involved in exopolysaccharide biosynthesis